jgi:hypothetical protein
VATNTNVTRIDRIILRSFPLVRAATLPRSRQAEPAEDGVRATTVPGVGPPGVLARIFRPADQHRRRLALQPQ